MNDLVSATALTMSTLEIAGICEKRHDNVIRDARAMFLKLGLSLKTEEKSGGNGRPLEVANLSKRECLILVSGYSVELRARIIDRWMELERVLADASAEAIVVEAMSPDARKAIGGIVKSGNGVQTRELEDFIVGVLERTIPSLVEQRLLADPRRAAVARDPALSFLIEAGAVQRRRGHLARRLSRALCALDPMEAHRSRSANTRTWLFDRDFAKSFMRQAGNAWVADHNSSAVGQGVLKLVVPRRGREEGGQNA